MFDCKKIEVHGFGLTAKTVTAEQLAELGNDGYSLIAGWGLNEQDYGPDKYYYMFEKLDPQLEP